MIEKAVIPAAGLGSRMLPLTKGVPKEMLPVGRKPMIQHIVEEAVASGLHQVFIVIREGKEIIRDYFRSPYLYLDKRDGSIDELERLISVCELTFIYQPQPLGIGDALFQARDFVGNSPFVMMVPDQLMHASIPATLQLTRRWAPGATIWTSLIRVPKEEIPFFYSSRGFELEQEIKPNEVIVGRIRTEKETHEAYRHLPFEVRGFGRTLYPPEIFDYLDSNFINPQTGEVDLLKTFAEGTKSIAHRGVILEGEPFDLGIFESYYHYLPRLWELSR